MCCLRTEICLLSWEIAVCARDDARNSAVNVERIRTRMEFPYMVVFYLRSDAVEVLVGSVVPIKLKVHAWLIG